MRRTTIGLLLAYWLFLAGCAADAKRSPTPSDWIGQPRPGSTKVK